MEIHVEKMAEFVDLLEHHSPQEGFNFLGTRDDVGTYRASEPHSLKPEAYEPVIMICGQGEKVAYIGGREFDYSVGSYLAVFLPMPLEATIITASLEKPLLMLGIRVDLHKIASLLLKIEQIEPGIAKPAVDDPSGIYSAPLHVDLLDAVIRLLKVLDNPTDTAILKDSILEEIYYRLLCDDKAGSLRYMLQQRDQIQQIARAVAHIHQHLDEVISVDELAGVANMSTSGFHRSFKEIMHMAPLQYAKSMKLHRAQALILEGKRANEAGYLVGYNSPAQFSREYKRLFGFSPSAT